MSPITVLIVEKLGNIKESSIKNFDENELYKKAGHTSATGFKCYTQWNIKDLNEKSYDISIFGKTTGRANSENKYEFPPPIDNTLFFGSCLIVNYNDKTPTSLNSDEWDLIYEHLYGGFEDIGDGEEDEESNDEEDEYAEIPVTTTGYAKDGFVVDDDEDDAEAYDSVDEEDEEPVYVKPPAPKKTKKTTVAKQTQTVTKKPSEKTNEKTNEKKTKSKASKTNALTNALTNVFTSIINEPNTYLDCTSELSEESYI